MPALEPIRAWALDWDPKDAPKAYSVVEPEPEPSLGNRLIVDGLTRGQADRIIKNYNQALGRACDLIDGLRGEVFDLNNQISMACVEPADGCDCSGCVYADEVHGVSGNRGSMGAT